MQVGSPKTVARKIAKTASELGAARFDFKYSAGTLPHDAMMRSVELSAREVIPTVPTVADAVPMPTNPEVGTAGTPSGRQVAAPVTLAAGPRSLSNTPLMRKS